jgi:2-furoyl-CoA dehydrogenase FAD binding subunit
MKPAAFDYLKPESVDEALRALASEGDGARLLAGGQSLAPMLNMRLVQPALLVDIAGLAELDRIEDAGEALVIGAAVTQARLQAWPGLDRKAPLLAEALPWVGHYQTRSRGTVCGSIAHADPSAELPLCLVALEGAVELRSVRGRRTMPAHAFFDGVLSTARQTGEMIASVRFPKRKSSYGYAFREVALRHGDFALAAIAAIASPDRLRIAVGGVADRPVARDWPLLSGDALGEALNAFAWELEARDDQHATASYRRGLVRRIGREAAEEAMRCRG